MSTDRLNAIISLPNNTYQFLTIPNKPGIGWYCLLLKNIKHCPHNMIFYGIIMIRFWQFLSAWYCLDTDSGNFQKTFDA